jgi:hypothetical protein
MASEGSLLATLGIGAVEAAMAIPDLYTSPSQSDPDDSGVRVITKGAKQGLIKAGYDVSTDAKFKNALLAVVGKNWETTKWGVILDKIRQAIEKYYSTIKLPTQPVLPPEVPFYKQPIVLIGGAVVAFMLLGGKKGRR